MYGSIPAGYVPLLKEAYSRAKGFHKDSALK